MFPVLVTTQYLHFISHLAMFFPFHLIQSGEVYDLIPDPSLEIPEWEKPWTGPDIPLTFGFQTTSNFPEQVSSCR